MEEILEHPIYNKIDKYKKKGLVLEYAFCEPPYGAEYDINQWIEFNQALFLQKDVIEIYRWNNKWSNYFDDGKEWWGTYFWTIYDKLQRIYIIICGSQTD